METREDLLKRAKELTQKIEKEKIACFEIQRSKDYLAVQDDINSTEKTISELVTESNDLRARQREMLDTVGNSTQELDDVKKMLVQLMEIEGVEGFTGDGISVSGKWHEKKSVNGRMLLEALGGDIDEFVTIVKPSQKAIKDYAVEHEDMKKILLGCIRLDSRELVDVDISLPEAV